MIGIVYGYEENSAFYLYFIEIKNYKQRYISLFLSMNIKNLFYIFTSQS